MRKCTDNSLVLLFWGAILTATVWLTLEARGKGIAFARAASAPSTLATGWVTDATGRRLRVGNYQRIVSCSSIADAILPDLIGTERVVAVSRWYAESNVNAIRLGTKPRIDRVEELEKILSLKPDLILISNYGGANSSIERLREQGLAVFDLGPMRGQVTLETNLRSLGALLGHPDDGERLAKQFHRRMVQVAAHIPASRRKRALYLNQYDTQLHGGTLGSSYYDVLTAAGLIDVGAIGKRFDVHGTGAWPKYRVEDILLMQPEVVVTVSGKGASICATAGFETLPACRDPQGIVELPEALLNDPGPGMLGTAEVLCDRVYGAVTTGH